MLTSGTCLCRKFYSLEALRQYKWYWRIEPGVDFHCAITYDPFVEMARAHKVYGYAIALREESRTCPSLFREMADWKESRGIPDTQLWKAMVSASWLPWPLRPLLSRLGHRDRNGDGWSLCHYWSNFEIASLDFFRGQNYSELVEHLDRTGGFYYERVSFLFPGCAHGHFCWSLSRPLLTSPFSTNPQWGDAAVHSLAVAMLLHPSQVHHFEDMGYRHDWFTQCPANAPGGQLPGHPMLGDFPHAPEMQGGIGCRCECDGRKTTNYPSFCTKKLKLPNTRARPSLSTWAWSYFW